MCMQEDTSKGSQAPRGIKSRRQCLVQCLSVELWGYVGSKTNWFLILSGKLLKRTASVPGAKEESHQNVQELQLKSNFFFAFSDILGSIFMLLYLEQFT